MKAICTKNICEHLSELDIVFRAEKGQTFDCAINYNGRFRIKDIEMSSTYFLQHFKIIIAKNKFNHMTYGEFVCILKNVARSTYTITPVDFFDIHQLIFRYNNTVFTITTNDTIADCIQVSFNDEQKRYSRYEDVLIELIDYGVIFMIKDKIYYL